MAKTEDLTAILQDGLNKIFKGEQVAHNLSAEDAPTNVKDWVSTGCSILDLTISNRKHGGIPVGRITEITGLEQSGKSLLSYHILAETQKKGGIAVLIDTEAAVDNPFLQAIGIDLDKLVYLGLDTIEGIFEAIEETILIVRKKLPDTLVTIVVDSVAGATTHVEQGSDYNKQGWNTTKAILISQGLRKITPMIAKQRIALVFTNQLRMKLGASPFADPYTTSGGMGIQFAASVRLRLYKAKKIKKKTMLGDETVGIMAKATIFKNRLGPPERSCDFDIFYNSGIDDYGSWLHILKKANIIKTSGAWFSYDIVDHETGEVTDTWKFQTKDFVSKLESDSELRERIYNDMADAVIMQYQKREEVAIDEDVIKEEVGEEEIDED